MSPHPVIFRKISHIKATIYSVFGVRGFVNDVQTNETESERPLKAIDWNTSDECVKRKEDFYKMYFCRRLNEQNLCLQSDRSEISIG